MDPKASIFSLQDFFILCGRSGLIILKNNGSLLSNFLDILPESIVGLDTAGYSWELKLLSQSTGKKIQIETAPASDFSRWIVIHHNEKNPIDEGDMYIKYIYFDKPVDKTTSYYRELVA